MGAEFALISARRSQIEPRAQAGSRMARTTLRAMENVSLVMAGAQLGITICSLGLGAVGEPAVAHLHRAAARRARRLRRGCSHPIAFAIALMVVVYLHVVLGEMVPKNIAIAGPEQAALVLGPPMMAHRHRAEPRHPWPQRDRQPHAALDRGASPGTRSARRTRGRRSPRSSRSPAARACSPTTSTAGSTGALGFTEKTIAEVLMPAGDLETVRRGSTAADVEALCAATGYSRFPVVSESDDLLGYLHIKDVLETDEERRNRVVDDKWIRPFAPVSVSDQLHDALTQLQQRGAHMALVVDPAGAVLGVATLEDVIEELGGRDPRRGPRRRAGLTRRCRRGG